MSPDHSRIFNPEMIYTQESPQLLMNHFENPHMPMSNQIHNPDTQPEMLHQTQTYGNFNGNYYPAQLSNPGMYEHSGYVTDPYSSIDDYSHVQPENRSLSQSSTTNTSPDESCNSFLQNSGISNPMDSTFSSAQHPSFSFAICAAAMACASNNPNQNQPTGNMSEITSPCPGGNPESSQVPVNSMYENSLINPTMDPTSFYTNIMQNAQSIPYDNGDLESFAEKFKQRRIKLGVTQADVGRALGKLKISGVGSLSQSTICRFESLTLSHNNMIALKPILQAWLEEAESQMYCSNNNGIEITNGSNNADTLDDNSEEKSLPYTVPEHEELTIDMYKLAPNTENHLDMQFMVPQNGSYDRNSFSPDAQQAAYDRKRKRTSITDAEKRSLEAFFNVQPRPSSDKIGQIADKLNLKKNVVRVWFCNQRQKQKRMKFKQANAGINQDGIIQSGCSTMEGEGVGIMSPEYSG